MLKIASSLAILAVAQTSNAKNEDNGKGASPDHDEDPQDRGQEREFLQWAANNNKHYKESVEFGRRFGQWKKADKKMKEWNPNATSKVSHNMFSDWTDEEFESWNGLKVEQAEDIGKRNLQHSTDESSSDESMDESSSDESDSDDERALQSCPEPEPSAPSCSNMLDYWDHAYAFYREDYECNWQIAENIANFPVQDQGYCGSCWAFSAVQNMQYQHNILSGEAHDLSEQQLVDCDPYNYGCSGGWMAYAYYYARNGMNLEGDYPYTGMDGSCSKRADTYVSTETENTWGFYEEYAVSPDRMKALIRTTVPAVAVTASDFGWRYYSGGIVSEDCGYGSINHAVNAVGYGFDEDLQMPFYLIKNSWGDRWGEGGFIKISARKSDAGYGNCQVNQYVQMSDMGQEMPVPSRRR